MKSSELETLTGTNFWKETTQSNNPLKTHAKYHTWIEFSQGHKSPVEFHTWMMLTFQEWQPNGSGTRKLQLSHGDLFTTSLICVITTDPIREPH